MQLMQIRPTGAASCWPNGVVHHDDGSYQLPTATPGVAARFTPRRRCWGLLPDRVDAVDLQGNRLEGRAGWSGRLVARDPQSGLETVLDPRARTVTVSTPEVRRPHEDGQRYFREAHQELDAEGTVRYCAGLRGECRTDVVTGPPGMVSAVPITLQDDKTWSQIELRPGQSPVACAMAENRKGEQTRGPALNASLSGEHRLKLVDEHGVSVSYELYLLSPGS